jgi:hypothetical protein
MWVTGGQLRGQREKGSSLLFLGCHSTVFRKPGKGRQVTGLSGAYKRPLLPSKCQSQILPTCSLVATGVMAREEQPDHRFEWARASILSFMLSLYPAAGATSYLESPLSSLQKGH